VVGFVIPGVAVFLAAILTFLAAPVLIMRRRNRGAQPQANFPTPGLPASPEATRTGSVATAVAGLARFRLMVLLFVVAVTAVAAVLALRLDPESTLKISLAATQISW
jgi:hypothetical protein